MSPKKRNWIAPVVLIALFFYMAVRIFSMNTAQPKVEYRTIIDTLRMSRWRSMSWILAPAS